MCIRDRVYLQVDPAVSQKLMTGRYHGDESRKDVHEKDIESVSYTHLDVYKRQGRAAKRLSELTGRKASTIHRLLEVDYTGGVVSFIHNDKNLLKCDVVILDEMSMVDVCLLYTSRCV